MTQSRYAVHLRRRREGKTDFRSRKQLLYAGKPRLVVRTSLRYASAQVISYTPQGDIVIAAANAKQLGPYGWKASCSNTPAAYLTGLLCGMRAKKAGVEESILDIGMRDVVKGARIFAILKALPMLASTSPTARASCLRMTASTASTSPPITNHWMMTPARRASQSI